MQNFSASPHALLACLWRNRHLLRASIKREILGRYRGSFMGLMWSLLNPLFMLAIFTFVFGVVFSARWGTASDSKTEFALILFAGLIIFNLFSECINRAPGLILGNPNYVKKVVFPLEILPLVILGSALFHSAISLAVWLTSYIIFFGIPPVTALWLPLIILPFALLIMGLSWILAFIGVFLRDVAQVIGLLTTALMFMSPIFYPASALPETYRPYLYMNPLTTIIEQTRNVLFWGIAPDFNTLAVYLIAGLAFCCLGFALFQKTRKGFADVL